MAFDLDDTLFDRRAAWRSLLEEWLGEAGALEIEMELMAADGHGHSPRREFFQWWQVRCPQLAASAGELEQRFRNGFPRHIRVDPFMADVLTELQSSGVVLALLSNGREAFQLAKLRACGAAAFFRKSHMHFSGTLGFAKPDPRAFHAVAHSLSLPAGAILFVGDDPLRDIQGARAAGMRSCRIRREGRDGGAEETDFTIDSLRELPELVKMLSCSGT